MHIGCNLCHRASQCTNDVRSHMCLNIPFRVSQFVILFSSKFSSWETQFLWNVQFVLTAHSFAHIHWYKIKLFVQFFKNSYWQWQKNSRLWIFAPKLLNLKFYNTHIQIQFGWKLQKRKKVFWTKIWILVQCVSCR